MSGEHPASAGGEGLIVAEPQRATAATVIVLVVDGAEDRLSRNRPDIALTTLGARHDLQLIPFRDGEPLCEAADWTPFAALAQRHARVQRASLNFRKAIRDMAISRTPWRTTRTLVTPARRRRYRTGMSMMRKPWRAAPKRRSKSPKGSNSPE